MDDIAYLNSIRRLELLDALPELPAGAQILEFGSGTGEQARMLAELGYSVIAIDLASSNYAKDRTFPVQDYDGRNIPLADASVDVIFSSNVLEHVENFDEISGEFRRILKPEGYAVHILPTATWRLWSFATGVAQSLGAVAGLPRALLVPAGGQGRGPALYRQLRRIASGFVPRAHGTAREGFSELWTFSRFAWRRRFKRVGFDVIRERPMGLFYTGTLLFGQQLAINVRRRLAGALGSATHLYVVTKSS